MKVPEWQVWSGDAEGLLASLPRDIDLLATDPPYGKVFLSNMNPDAQGILGDSDQEKVNRIMLGVWTKIRPSRHAYVFGPRRSLPGGYAELIWDKKYMSAGNLASPWGTQHEAIGFHVQKYPSEAGRGSLSAKLRSGSVLRVASPRGSARKGLHPNYKPVDLWRALIESSTNPGDLVVDPFAGSFSSGVACLLSGRRYIGIELDPAWADAGKQEMIRVESILREI